MMIQQKQINITESVDYQLQQIANNSVNEECALLFGSEVDGICNVDDFYRLTNMDMSPVSFQFDTKEMLRAFTYASSVNKMVVSVWHSHPQGMPFPSNKDHHYMNSFPLVWVIYAKKANKSKSFIRDGEEIVEIMSNIT